MAAGYQDLFMEQGTTYYETIILNDSYGNPYNLTGFRISSQAKQSYYSANATLVFTTSIVDASNGVIGLSANSSQTANILTSPAVLVYDVLLKDSSNNVTRVLEGRIFVDPVVTSTHF
jgi:hypothetical protein